jgi:hypothetical protein
VSYSIYFSYLMCFSVEIFSSVVNSWVGDFNHVKSLNCSLSSDKTG